jgi:hypothetical protein
MSMKGHFVPVLGVEPPISGRDLAKSRSDSRGLPGFGAQGELQMGKSPDINEGSLFKKVFLLLAN